MFNSKCLRNAASVGLLVLLVLATGLWAQSSVKTADDQLLKMIPAESLFCIRVNHFEYTLSQIDQFLAGVSPMPMGISMLARMQLAKVLGSPQINGVNMNGNLVIFGAIPPGEQTQTNPISKVFIGGLVPLTDYRQLISDNPNCGQPDEKGVSKITSNGTPILLVTQVGNYALISWANDYAKLVAMAKSMSAAKAAGLAGTLDATEAKLAMTEPIWAYGNVQQASKTFGNVVSGKIEELKTTMKSIDPNRPGAPPMMNIENIMNMYASILETFTKETQYLSIAINPKPNVLNITKTISAVPGTDMANMFVADTSADQKNKLLGYLEDGAFMNFGFKINSSFWKEFNIKSIDLLAAMAGENMTTKDIDRMKALAADAADCVGGPIACSASIDIKTKPPFVAKYVIAVKDKEKFNRLIDEAMQMFNTSGIMDFYKDMGIETGLTIERGVDRYKDVSIDSAKFTMKSTDANSPQGQMINVMYGGGFDYRWGMVDGLWVCTIGSNANSAIRELIDQVKAGGPKQIGDEMKTALTLLPEADKADFVVTYNFLRLFKMVTAMVPVPIPQMDISTKSNIVFAGKAGNGKIVVDIALPKEHLTEIMAAFQTAFTKSRDQGKRAISLNNLKQIALACLIYSDEHDGKFAPDLQQLYPYHRNPKILESPRKPKDFDGPSYIYIAGLNRGMQEPWKIIIAYENPAFCSDGICAAFLDGHSESMRPAEFLKRLQATYKRLGRKMPEIKFKGFQSRGINSISPEETIWVKCQNPDCKATYQMGKRAYFKYVEEHADPMSSSAPALVCKKCSEQSVFRAEKCMNPDCGHVFLRGTVPNDFVDRCPKCNHSEIEEIRKRRRKAAKFVIPKKNLQIPEEMQTCAANFRKIQTAIKKYKNDKGKLPNWLSDLVPNYLSSETLYCSKDTRHKSPYSPDPILPCSYGWQFSAKPIPSGWDPTGRTLYRDWKTQQVKLFGDVVPMVRCYHHGSTKRVLNLSAGGEIWWGPLDWEYMFKPDYRFGDESATRSSQRAGPPSDAEPADVEGPSSLEKLDLSGTQITDSGLARRLEGLTSLRELNLRDTRISDAGLVHLKDLTSLRSLNLSRTQITGKSNPLLGQPLTDLKFTSLNGEQIDISKYKGKVVLVDFWATWCGPCIRELPNVKKAYTGYHDKGFEIIGISLDKSRAALEKFIEENHIPWPQHFDGKGWKNEISTRFDIRSIPATFLLDQKGIIRYTNLRGSALERTVADLLQGSSLPNAQITGAGLAHLKDLTLLEVLRLEGTKVTDEGLAHLKGLIYLKTLFLGNTQITDAGLLHLKNLTGLQRLCAHNTQVTNVGLAHLKDLVGLEYLCVHDTQVTDASLVHLKGLTSLETLYLHNTGVSDVGVVHLKGLTSLRQLNLHGTKVSSAGLAELKQALPSCSISGPRPSTVSQQRVKVTGVVRDEVGKPVDGAEISISPSGSQVLSTDAEGKFEVNWQPRRLGGSQREHYLVARHRQLNLATAVEIDEDTENLDIKLTPGVILSGKVVDVEGKGIPSADISLIFLTSNRGYGIREVTKIDAEGNYEIRAVPSGYRYFVSASAEGYGQQSVRIDSAEAIDDRMELEPLGLAIANLSVSGVVVDADDRPVADARVYCSGMGQPYRRTQTDAEGKFTLEKICEGQIRITARVSGKTPSYGYIQTEGGATDVKVVISERPSATRYIPKQPPSLGGKPLPNLKDFKIELSPADATDKMLLVCFWDMNQRPSRHCIRQLAEKAKDLAEKGVTVVCVQASDADEKLLNEWVKDYKIPFPVGRITVDVEEPRFAWGVKALPWLILTDRKHIVRAEGFDLGGLDKKIETATLLAGDVDQVQLQISKGADINTKDEEGLTALHLAARQGRKDVVELLLANGANINARLTGWPGWMPLHEAAAANHKEVAELLIAKGADANADCARAGGGRFGGTPLHEAVFEGHRDMAELLISKGANINAKQSGGLTPLDVAAFVGHKDVVELLIARGADVNIRDRGGRTALRWAKHGRHKEIVELLQKHRAEE